MVDEKDKLGARKMVDTLRVVATAVVVTDKNDEPVPAYDGVALNGGVRVVDKEDILRPGRY